MNTRKSKEYLNNFRILLDSGYSSTFLMGMLIKIYNIRKMC